MKVRDGGRDRRTCGGSCTSHTSVPFAASSLCETTPETLTASNGRSGAYLYSDVGQRADRVRGLKLVGRAGIGPVLTPASAQLGTALRVWNPWVWVAASPTHVEHIVRSTDAVGPPRWPPHSTSRLLGASPAVQGFPRGWVVRPRACRVATGIHAATHTLSHPPCATRDHRLLRLGRCGADQAKARQHPPAVQQGMHGWCADRHARS